MAFRAITYLPYQDSHMLEEKHTIFDIQYLILNMNSLQEFWSIKT